MGFFDFLKSQRIPKETAKIRPEPENGRLSTEPVILAEKLASAEPTQDKERSPQAELAVPEVEPGPPSPTPGAPEPVAGFTDETSFIYSAPPPAGTPEPITAPPPLSAETILVRLAPILESLPVELEKPALRKFANTELHVPIRKTLIEEQLSSGRVAIPIQEFIARLPPEMGGAFGLVDSAQSIPVPLEEIFRVLPVESICTRPNQSFEPEGKNIVSPFSEYTREEVQLPEPELAAPGTPLAVENRPDQLAVSSQGDFNALRQLLLTDEELSISRVIDLLSGLPGIQRGLLTTIDGQTIAGDLGESRLNRAAGFLLPKLFSTTERTLNEISFQALETLVLHFPNEQLACFAKDSVCLTVLHLPRALRPGVRETLVKIAFELARLPGLHSEAAGAPSEPVAHADS
jgi:predicted regulator of Ras-like GTPase activity (Roadblock/LC7/MglB family)